jgi:hypothetical protein
MKEHVNTLMAAGTARNVACPHPKCKKPLLPAVLQRALNPTEYKAWQAQAKKEVDLEKSAGDGALVMGDGPVGDAVFATPQYWVPQSKDYELFDVKESSPEVPNCLECHKATSHFLLVDCVLVLQYKWVIGEFKSRGLPNQKVQKLERVQCKSLHDRYMLARARINNRNKGYSRAPLYLSIFLASAHQQQPRALCIHAATRTSSFCSTDRGQTSCRSSQRKASTGGCAVRMARRLVRMKAENQAPL